MVTEKSTGGERAEHWRRRLRSNVLLQILLILAFWQAGEVIVRLMALPFPGALAGMGLIMALLIRKKLQPEDFQLAVRWFMGEMVLFLLPATVSLLTHPEFFGVVGILLVAAVLAGTILVMVVTALAVELGYRMTTSDRRREHA